MGLSYRPSHSHRSNSIPMGHESTPDPVTLVYKTVPAFNSTSEGETSEIPLHLDVYLPGSHSDRTGTSGDDGVGVPAVVYFHGGGLLVGNRRSWFPEWLHGESFPVTSIRLCSLTNDRWTVRTPI